MLESTTTLDISAASVNKAAGSVKVFTVDENGNNLASAAALYVKTAGVADMQVQSGAQLTSGGKATLGAYNDATAKGQVKVLSNNSLGRGWWWASWRRMSPPPPTSPLAPS